MKTYTLQEIMALPPMTMAEATERGVAAFFQPCRCKRSAVTVIVMLADGDTYTDRMCLTCVEQAQYLGTTVRLAS